MTDKKKIYIIDDDTALRTAYAVELNKLGYSTETAEDGIQGEALLKKGRPDLILLDMLMPNMDGMTFLRQLRQDKANSEIKIVVVSNFESLPEADDLNVAKYLSKMQQPPDAVAAAVDNILKAEA